MCGISGVISFASSQAVRELKFSLDTISAFLTSRGPDAHAQWFSPGHHAALDHKRLSIIDPDTRSDQPMVSQDGRYMICFNGEIYNYKELRKELTASGFHFRTAGDTEVLLQMFAQYGPAMLPRLRGMYAFAVWDEHEQRLFLARDPFGIKPLYYTQDRERLCFASQVKALVALPGVDLREQPAGHVGFFLWGSVPEPYTLYRGIHCLPSGHWMTVGRDGASKLQKFASPVDEFGQYSLQDMPRNSAECMGRLHNALAESMRMHQIADVPCAIFLSAGIDSSVIAALTAEQNLPATTLTLGFDMLRDSENDEVPLAQAVAKHYDMLNHSHLIGQSFFLEHRDHILKQMDQPTIDGVNSYLVSWLAQQFGFRVALSGVGGDEMFGGYPSFEQIPRTVRALAPLAHVPSLGRAWRILTARAISRFTSSKYASLLEYGSTWGGAYLLRRGLYMPWELPEFLDPDLVRTGWQELNSIAHMNALVQPIDSLPQAKKTELDFLHVSGLEMTYYMRSQLLRDADWAGMAHSIEVRVPFVDTFLLRQLAPLRASPFFVRKPSYAACLKKPLPPAILNRPKTGFHVPVREWMQQNGERGLRAWARFVYGAKHVGTNIRKP